MTDIFSYPTHLLDGGNGRLTLCSGPIVISQDGKILLHISSSTGKYQFIGGRMNIQETLLENARNRASEVIDIQNLEIFSDEPLCIEGEIERNGNTERLVLFHFQAKLKDEANIGSGEWKTLEEIEALETQNMLSSKNVYIAAKYFLEKV